MILYNKSPRIVYFHLVSETSKPYYRNRISLSSIEEQLQFFKKNYDVISVREAYCRYLDGIRFTNQLIITTDDGFSENYSVLLPLMKKYQLKYVPYICDASINNANLLWRHGLFVIMNSIGREALNKKIMEFAYENQLDQQKNEETLMGWSLRVFPNKDKEKLMKDLWRRTMDTTVDEYLEINRPYLSTEQINEILDCGNEIGSHSATHPYFDKLSEKEIVAEVSGSIRNLSKMFNTNIISFSFPFGRNNAATSIIGKLGDVKVCLGVRETCISNSKQPLLWERTNIEGDHWKRNFFITPYKRLLQTVVKS